MSFTERISRVIVAAFLVPFILIILAFIAFTLLIIGIGIIFLPLAVLIKPEILEIK